MNLDDFLAGLPDDADRGEPDSADSAPVTLSARLVGHDDEVVEIEIFGTRYAVQRSAVIDIAPAARAIAVTSTNAGTAIELTVLGGTELKRCGSVSAAALVHSTPMVVRRPSVMPARPLVAEDRATERAWLTQRGLVQTGDPSLKSWTSSWCSQQVPTSSTWYEETQSQTSDGALAVDDSRPVSGIDDWQNSTVVDDQSWDEW